MKKQNLHGRVDLKVMHGICTLVDSVNPGVVDSIALKCVGNNIKARPPGTEDDSLRTRVFHL